MATPVLPTPSAVPPPWPRRPPLADPGSRRALRNATLACSLLRRHGWSTSLAELRIAGDADVRLLAALPSAGVAVELLCPCLDLPDRDEAWTAVRIGHADDRTVWHGPGRDCTPEALARFLDDLARRPVEELERSYGRCG